MVQTSESIKLQEIVGSIDISVSPNKFEIHESTRQKIDEYWENTEGRFFNGGLYVVENIDIIDGRVALTVSESDFAHYLYSVNNNIDEIYIAKILYTSCLLVTHDGYLIIVETSLSGDSFGKGKLQLVGGIIDKNDLIEGNKLGAEESIRRETLEEVGLELPSTYKRAFIKTGGKNKLVGILYVYEVDFYKHDIMEIKSKVLDIHSKEIDSLIFLQANIDEIDKFFDNSQHAKVDYLEPLIKAYLSMDPA